MAAKPKRKHLTPGQRRATAAWSAAGLKAISRMTHAQRSAAARKAAATRKARGHSARRQAAEAVDGLPVCAAEAVLACAPWPAGPGDVVALWLAAGEMIAEVAEAAGARPERCEPGTPGAVLGLVLGDGRPHAVLDTGAGWVSWGRLVVPAGTVEEAWLLDWGGDD